MMGHGLRKVVLTAHVASSVGWLGTVAAFLALAIVGLRSDDTLTVRAVYLACELITWATIVPLSLVSLTTGILQGLGTSWGLFKHYWVLFKLILTAVSTALLMLHTRPITMMATAAAERALASGELEKLRMQLVMDSGLAILVLLVTTVLSVFKPKGLTRWGRASTT